MTSGRRLTDRDTERLRASLPEIQTILQRIQRISRDLERTVDHAETCSQTPEGSSFDHAYMCDLEDEISRLETDLSTQIERLSALRGFIGQTKPKRHVSSTTRRN